MPLPFYITVKVFSASGEQVATLYSGGISEMPGSPQLVGSVVQAGHQGVGLQFSGVLNTGLSSLVWTGVNETGGAVSGGIYYIHVESVDQFGTSSSYNLGVNVIQPAADNQINIFNSAGELVYQESYNSLTSTVTDLSIKDAAFVPLFDANGVALAKLNGVIRSSDGSSQAWSWDGKNMQGALVKPGVYTVVLSSAVAGGAGKNVVRSVQVLAALDEFDAKPIVAYSKAGSSSLQIRYNPAAAQGTVRARIYNLAGELIGHASAGAASGSLSIDIGRNASGIYIVTFDYVTPSHTQRRSLLKAAVLR